MSWRHPDRKAWLAPGAVVVAAALAGAGARSLWPTAPAQSTTAAQIPVSTAQVVRTDVAQRQVVAGTVGYRGSYTVADELPAERAAGHHPGHHRAGQLQPAAGPRSGASAGHHDRAD